MLRKFAIITVLFFTIFFSVPATAQTDSSSLIPALNPFCWKRVDCWNVRKQYLVSPYSEKDLNDGFITNASMAPCVGGDISGGPGEWGRCLPAGKTKTEISFGGKAEFSNIGEFIVLMYKYLITIASIVAVVMIILAGIQWLTSGGNSESISSAKHRIGGAIIGLFIAFMSYFILNTINPALINFRLPQVWLIRPQSLIPMFCNQVPGAASGAVKFSYFAGAGEQQKAVTVKDAQFNLTYTSQKEASQTPMFTCGRRFLVEGGGTQACFGNICGDSVPHNRQTCVNDINQKMVLCRPGELRINFRISVGASEVKEQALQLIEKIPPLIINTQLFASKLMDTNWRNADELVFGVCQNNDRLYLANDSGTKRWADSDNTKIVSQEQGTSDGYTTYAISYTKLADFEDEGWNCTRGGNLVGYLFRTETSVKQSGLDYLKQYGGGLYSAVFGGQCTEPNLIIGFDKKTEQPVFGVFGEDVKNLNYYIPIEVLRDKGLELNVNLTVDKLTSMIARCGSVPRVLGNIINGGDPVE